jgi:hypothetical protein
MKRFLMIMRLVEELSSFQVQGVRAVRWCIFVKLGPVSP